MLQYIKFNFNNSHTYFKEAYKHRSMNYIGSKYKLIPFIKENIHAVAGNDLSGAIFCDLFAGTGIVGLQGLKKLLIRLFLMIWNIIALF